MTLEIANTVLLAIIVSILIVGKKQTVFYIYLFTPIYLVFEYYEYAFTLIYVAYNWAWTASFNDNALWVISLTGLSAAIFFMCKDAIASKKDKKQ